MPYSKKKNKYIYIKSLGRTYGLPNDIDFDFIR